MTIPYEFERKLYRILLITGIFIVIYALIWILVGLHIIPSLVLTLFPPVLLLMIGMYVIYISYSRR
ncbi:hypothetical protein [uncultured Methanobrevibacter sp.]|uniref:hypothetical protein n=1 Tax=uncultured Methanobrevibacter sp. TaxID=253161 RepID=UPI0025ECD521|nr:hypothetical protein [uncultured Methanobrevibacter sp.]